jgi:hypothetical protein
MNMSNEELAGYPCPECGGSNFCNGFPSHELVGCFDCGFRSTPDDWVAKSLESEIF